MHRNPLERLPGGIRALNLDAKQWKELYDQIDWSTLERLNIKEVGLKGWRQEMLYSTVLTHLDVSDNHIRTFPRESECWYRMKVLHLEKNNIKFLPINLKS